MLILRCFFLYSMLFFHWKSWDYEQFHNYILCCIKSRHSEFKHLKTKKRIEGFLHIQHLNQWFSLKTRWKEMSYLFINTVKWRKITFCCSSSRAKTFLLLPFATLPEHYNNAGDERSIWSQRNSWLYRRYCNVVESPAHTQQNTTRPQPL